MNHHCNGVAPCRWERESERIRALVVRAFGELQAAVGNPKRAVSYAKSAMAILEKVGPPAPAPSPSTEERFALVYDQGGEEIGLYTKGHIDPGPFREGATMWLKASAAAFGLDPSGGLLDALLEEDVRWEWWVDEAGDGGDLAVVFRPGAKGDPGAYPVTCLAFEGGVLAAPRAPVDAKTAKGD